MVRDIVLRGMTCGVPAMFLLAAGEAAAADVVASPPSAGIWLAGAGAFAFALWLAWLTKRGLFSQDDLWGDVRRAPTGAVLSVLGLLMVAPGPGPGAEPSNWFLYGVALAVGGIVVEAVRVRSLWIARAERPPDAP